MPVTCHVFGLGQQAIHFIQERFSQIQVEEVIRAAMCGSGNIDSETRVRCPQHEDEELPPAPGDGGG